MLHDYKEKLQNRKNDASKLKELSNKEIVIRMAHKLLDIANAVMREVVMQHQLQQDLKANTRKEVA